MHHWQTLVNSSSLAVLFLDPLEDFGERSSLLCLARLNGGLLQSYCVITPLHVVAVRSLVFEYRRKILKGKDGGVKVAYLYWLALGFLRGAVSREVEQIGRSSLLPSTF